MNEQEQEQMQKVLEFAKQYIARGWKIVPLRYKEKRAFIEGWQNLRIAENELEKYFLENGQAHNIGLLLGEPSNWLVDVDLDHAFAVEVAPVFLENTGVVFGRKSKKASHWLYYSTNARTTKFMIPARLAKQITGNAEDTTIIEIRSTGAQTMAPPSIHPDNEQVEWFAFGEPATVEYEELLKRTGKIASATLLALVWQKGTRQDTAMALAGALLRSGWSEEETEKFIQVVAGLAGDEETKDRIRAAEYTSRKIGASPTTGWKRLSELLGEEAVRLVIEWLQVGKEKEETAEIEEFTDEELWNANLPEPSWLVEGLLPETGLTLIAGKPKIGKSWLALSIATGIAHGGEVAGIQAKKQANTIYLTLEDTPRRLKKRLKMVEERPSGKCTIVRKFGKMTPENLRRLEEKIKEKNAKVVIIDPLGRIQTTEKNTNLYNADYESLGMLKDLADRMNIAIIVIHHLKKGESDDPLEDVLGTTAIIGVVDTILVMKRTRGQADATLFITGREIEDKEIALEFEAGKWKVLGDAREIAITREEKKVLQTLEELGVASPKEIAELAEMNPNTVKTALRRLAGENKVKVVDRGKYTLENAKV